jgi:hypothetical protein
MISLSRAHVTLLATAAVTVAVTSGAAVWVTGDMRRPRVPDSVVDPVKRAASVRFDVEATNPTDAWYYRYVVLDTPPGANDAVTWCVQRLADNGWSRPAGMPAGEAAKGRYTALVVDARKFAATADATERQLFTAEGVDLQSAGCVLVFSP